MSKPLSLVIGLTKLVSYASQVFTLALLGFFLSHASLGTVFHHVLSPFFFGFPFLTPSISLSATPDMQPSSFHF